MIRINLLAVGRPEPTKRAPAPPSVVRHVLTFGFSLVLAGGTDLGFYRVWSTKVDDLQKQFKDEKRRQAELAGVQQQNQRYLAQLQLLQSRIDTIQKLQNSRSGPVDFLASLGDVVNRTNDLFLFTVTPAGDRLNIRGQCRSVESMAQFIAALKDSGHFDDVQLRQYWEDDEKERLTYKFNLDCVYRPPAAAPTPGAQPAAAPGPSTTGRRAGM